MLAAALVAGCVERVYPDGPPLRDGSTAEERAYLACVTRDRFFRTEACRAARDALSRDPRPGVTGR